MVTISRFALQLALVLTGGLATATAAETDVEATIRAAFGPIIEEHDIPGLAVAVVVDGERHFFSHGVASRESGAAVTEHTVFELGSVSKTFTATLAGYAEQVGKLSMDDSPGQYLPELAGTALDQASLLNLGTYTAGGLPLQFPGSVADDAGTSAYFQQWQAEAEPGTQRRYSNPSIGLLGHIAGRALGGSFPEALSSNVLAALQLGDTHVTVPAEVEARYAWGYNKDNRPVRVNPGPFDDEAYGVKSTAAGMIAFVEANLEPARVPAPLGAAIAATHEGHFSVGPMIQGLGWEQYPYPVSLEQLLAGNAATMAMEPNAATALVPPVRPTRPTLFNKTGSTNGFGAYIAFVPEERVGIVVLANRNYPIPARIAGAHAVLEALAAR